MKYLLVSIAILYSMHCAAQPNPDLFQTWYLESFYASDFSPEITVADISPAITPTLTIMPNLNFNGNGACNAFNGAFAVPFPDFLETSQLSGFANDCGIAVHNSFEDEYFEFLQSGGTYWITSEIDGQVLHLSTMVFGYGVFKRSTLSTTESDVSQIEISPNPSSSIISVKSQENSILKVEIFNTHGHKVKTVTHLFENIEISDLASGMYLMKVFTESGTVNKKVLKN